MGDKNVLRAHFLSQLLFPSYQFRLQKHRGRRENCYPRTQLSLWVTYEMSPEDPQLSQYPFAAREGGRTPISLLRIQPEEVNMILLHFLWMFTNVPLQVFFNCVNQTSDRFSKHLGALVSTRRDSVNSALAPAASLVGTNVPPASNEEIQ